MGIVGDPRKAIGGNRRLLAFSKKRSKSSNAHLRAFVPVPTRILPQVAVLGAAGGIGQSLSLLLKMNPLISELSLYDLRGTAGVAADLSHTNTGCAVTGYEGAENPPPRSPAATSS